MTAVKKMISIEEFIHIYEGQPVEYLNGYPLELQATVPDHGYAQINLGVELSQFFKERDPKNSDGWWILTEAAVSYGSRYLFSHDLAGWKTSTLAQRPRNYPILERPDWVCEILSTNHRHDQITKKQILHEYKVPYYWIVDPTSQILYVFEWSEKAYLAILTLDKSYKGRIPPFLGGEIELMKLFGNTE